MRNNRRAWVLASNALVEGATIEENGYWQVMHWHKE
jgi:hypothetical protein